MGDPFVGLDHDRIADVGGCGCGSCAPIPGGFPADQRRPDAITAKLTPREGRNGLKLLNLRLAVFLLTFLLRKSA